MPSSNKPKPTIGRVVRFVDLHGNVCAATIAKVWNDDCINLGYLYPNGVACSATSVVYADDGRSYSWHWPQTGAQAGGGGGGGS